MSTTRSMSVIEKSVKYLQTKYGDFEAAIEKLFHLSRKDDLEQFFNEICAVVMNHNIHPKTMLYIIHIAASVHVAALPLYARLYELFYKKFKVKLVKHMIRNATFCLICCQMFKQDWDISSYSQSNLSLNELLYVYPENHILYFIVQDKVDDFRILTQGGDFDFDMHVEGKKLIDWAAHYGSLNCFRYLMSRNAKITFTTLKESFHGGQNEIVSDIMRITGGKYTPDASCMDAAVRSHDYKSVQYLFANYHLHYELTVSAAYYNFKLYANAISVPEPKNVDLTSVILFGIPSLVKYFVDQKANAKITNSDGTTCLHILAMLDNPDLAKMFLDYGVEVDAKNKNGETPLHVCAINNSMNVAQVLIAHGANIEEKNNAGETPLMLSTKYSAIETGRVLVENKANINEIKIKPSGST